MGVARLTSHRPRRPREEGVLPRNTGEIPFRHPTVSVTPTTDGLGLSTRPLLSTREMVFFVVEGTFRPLGQRPSADLAAPVLPAPAHLSMVAKEHRSPLCSGIARRRHSTAKSATLAVSGLALLTSLTPFDISQQSY